MIVDAEPLEDSHAEISEGDLQENAKMLAEKIVAAHPELILNIDESGLDCKRDTHKLKIVSSNACPRVYLSPRAESHITFLCGIGATGWQVRPMVIVKIQSVVSDLAVHFGFPTSEHAEIVSFSSAYINEQLFSHWITSILVLSVEM